MNDLHEEIRQKELELFRLKERAKKEENWKPEQRVAVKLHETFCHQNHADGCGWGYEKDKPDRWEQSTHLTYLQRAKKIVDAIGEDAAVKFMKAYDGSKSRES